MKVILTGDRGYIGTEMKIHLRENGHHVLGIDTNYFKYCNNGDVEMEEYHLDKDIRDVTKNDLVGYDAVIHLAALSNDIMGDIDPEVTVQVNYLATVRLARLAKQAGVKRFLFASSCSVYGANDEYVTENSPISPLTTYAKSKAMAEQDILLLADESFSPVILRNATVYGMSGRIRNDLVVNAMSASAYTTGKISVFGDGSLWRPLISVQDLCRVFIEILSADKHKIHAETFNVGFTNYTIEDVAIIVQSITGAEIEYTPSNDIRNYKVDFTKLSHTFPNNLAHPQVDIARSVFQMVNLYKDIEAYRESNLTKDDLISNRFVRLSKLKQLMVHHKIDKNLRWV